MFLRTLIPLSFLLFSLSGTFGQELEKENNKEAFLESLKRLQEVESFSYRTRSAYKWLHYSEKERDSLFGNVIVHKDPEDTVFGARFRGSMTRIRKANSEADTSRVKVHYDGEYLLKYRPSSEYLTIYRAKDAKDHLSHFSRILKPNLLDPSSFLERSKEIEVKNAGKNARMSCERFQFVVPSSNESFPPFYNDWCFGQNGRFPVLLRDSTRYQGRYQEQELHIKDLKLNEQVLKEVQKVEIDSGKPETYSSVIDLMASKGTARDSVEIEFYDPSKYRESEAEKRERLTNVDPAPELKGLFFPLKKGKDSTVLEAPFEADLLLLDFWYMDCAPCRKAIPHLNELHEKYEQQGLRVVGVDPMDKADRMAERWANFSKHNPITYEILLTRRKIAERFHVRGYPTFFLFDSKGQLLMVREGIQEQHMEDLEKTVQQEIGK